MTDIVERLRDRSDPMTNEIMELAADEIERLRHNFEAQSAQNERLVEEIERLRKALASSCDDQRQLFREELNFPCEAAMDNEVLRGLLREIADYSGDSGVVERVREALGEKNDSKNT